MICACSSGAPLTGPGGGPAGDPEDPGSAAREAGVTSQGDCVAIGHGNEQDCLIINLPQEVEDFGGIDLSWGMDGGQTTVYFDGPIEEAPKPPDYAPITPNDPEWGEPEIDGAPSSNPVNHCNLWEEWFQENTDIYRVGATVNASLWGGPQELVAITNATVDVFERPEPAPQGVLLQCAYGAGGDYGAVIEVDTENRQTTLIADQGRESEVSAPMPPASLSMNDPTGAPTLTALININSPRYLYSGMLTVDGRVGDQTPYVHIGTPREPIRWLGALKLAELDMSDRYGWNIETQEWEHGFTPGDLTDIEWH